jgi:hypothetical protein
MQELSASVGSVVASASCFEEIEDGVFASVCEFGRRETAAALRARDARLCGSVPLGWRVKDRRIRTVLTRYGPVEIERRRYVDGSGATRYLLDESLDLEKRARVSPSLERLLVKLSTEVSFRSAAEVVSVAVGTHVSHSAAHALLGRAGKRLATQGAAASADLFDLGLDPGGTQDAASLSCEADGTVIALQNSGRCRGEVKLAVFYTDKATGLGAVHAGFQAASDFWGEAVAAAGSHYDLASVRSCVVAGDGARWVRGGLEVLPYSHFQLDPFHIHKAILRASGDHGLSARTFCVLYEDGLHAADGMLSRFATEHPERADDIEDVRRYLASNADGLWRSDPSHGTIEGHIDKILANRMKKRGRRWSPKGADAMAHVLAAQRSRRPVPCGTWSAPTSRPDIAGTVQAAPRRRRSRVAPQGHVPQAHVVSHKTGESFTRTLRDISGTRKADY